MRNNLLALMGRKNPDLSEGMVPQLATTVPAFASLTSLNYNDGNYEGVSTVSANAASYTGSSSVTSLVGLPSVVSVEFDIELSDEKTRLSHYLDLAFLAGFVPMHDDKSYPFRTDSNVGVAPLITYNQHKTQTDPGDAGVAPAVYSAYDGTAGPATVIHGGYNVTDPNFGTEYVLVDMTFTSGQVVSQPITSSVQQPSAWTLSQGTLPSGLSLTGNTISGTVSDAAGSGGAVIVRVDGLPRYDGSILGQFNPAGYGYTADADFQGHFDFRHITWDSCEYEDSEHVVHTEYYVKSYGAWTPNYLPANCTQWTDPVESGIMWIQDGNPPEGLRKGGWIHTNSFGTYSILQKWMEANCGTWPSHSWDRPCGADDRLLVDQNLITCDEGDGTPLCEESEDLTACLRFPGAPDCDLDSIWHDNTPKHTFVFATWNKDAATCTTECLSFSNRCPMLMVISPNSADRPKNGFFTDGYDLTKITADGGGWSQSDVIQNCDSLFWQQSKCFDPAFLPLKLYTEHPPDIEGGGGFDGLGNALPLQIEPVCEVPAGAPALPDGISLPDFSSPSNGNPRSGAGWPWQICPA
jgi:hypothetical protein